MSDTATSQGAAKLVSCKNCATEFNGKYCPQCGQKAKTARITIKVLINDIRQHFIHYDQGYLHTALELAKRPGHTVLDYIDGKRVKLIKPIKFLLLASTLSILVNHFIGMDEVLLNTVGQQSQSEKQQQFTQSIMKFLLDHPVVIQLVMIPMLALMSWLFFRKRGHNYAEHLVTMSFLMGEMTLLAVFTAILNLYLISVVNVQLMSFLNFLSWGIYFGWAYRQIYGLKHWFSGLWRGILVVWLSYILLIICSSIATLIFLFIYRDVYFSGQ